MKRIQRRRASVSLWREVWEKPPVARAVRRTHKVTRGHSGLGEASYGAKAYNNITTACE